MQSADFVQFIVVPHTGIQICRDLPVPERYRELAAELWSLAGKQAERSRNEAMITGLINGHLACAQAVESSGWIACDPHEFAYFRLTRIGSEMKLDLALSTHGAAGKQIGNRIDCLVEGGKLWSRRSYHLASFYVSDPQGPRNVPGLLIMDFGNTASSFIFAETGKGPIATQPIPIHLPFDPRHDQRPRGNRGLLRSNMALLHVPASEQVDPWLVLGDYAEELIQREPLITYLHAPKKYVRHWPSHLQPREPATQYRGVIGQRLGMYPMLRFVEQTLGNMLEAIVASLTNPNLASRSPALVPQVKQIALTYPLTWREEDKDLFRGLVERVARAKLALPERFQVELVCSEPVAVAAYIIWKTFFHFGSVNLPLAASYLGNPAGTPELRLLVVDIGGGSTDIALLDVEWSTHKEESEEAIEVTFRPLESMRFNRAGDRLSHLIATALFEFLRDKYGIEESLDFNELSSKPAFTLQCKRQAVSGLSQLVEQAKAGLTAASSGGVWNLTPEDEAVLVRYFLPLLDDVRAVEAKAAQVPRFQLTVAVLDEWIRQDRQSIETQGEPGFMDIFLYLGELRASLAKSQRLPHLVILSGRTSRLSFIKHLTAWYLRLPPHRVRTVAELWPDSLKVRGHEAMDKLAVVCGAHCFRSGDHIRFRLLAPEPIFTRFVGTTRTTPDGLRLNRLLARPGERHQRTTSVPLEPSRNICIGHAFREEGAVEVIASLTNLSAEKRHDVRLRLVNDYTVHLERPADAKDVVLEEWVPGGTDVIVDNFNDTGKIDREPDGFLRKIVRSNQTKWCLQEV